MTRILTIGHSNHEIADFLQILRRHGISILVDARSDPHSRYAPEFNKRRLEESLQAAGIAYRYSGARIGGRPRDPSLYTESGQPDYDRLAATDGFQTELRSIAEMAADRRLVIMCSEADPMACHREQIIARLLRSWGVRVNHVLPDGKISPSPEEMKK